MPSLEAIRLEKDWNRNTLPENEWVAMGKDGLIDHDPNLDELFKKLKSKSVKSGDYLLAFIPAKGTIIQ